MADNKRSNPRRDERARQAARHIADVENRLASEVAASVAGLRAYDSPPSPPLPTTAPRASRPSPSSTRTP